MGQKRPTEKAEGPSIELLDNTMDILWEPEVGTCTECGEKACGVRKYSSRGRVRTFCFPCWATNQEPYVMSSLDWRDEERVIFESGDFPAEEPPSRAA